MNLLTKLPKPVSRFAGKMLMKARKASPELCIIGGLVLGGGAIVAVGVQTWKKKDVLQSDATRMKEAKTDILAKKEEAEKNETALTADDRRPLLSAKIDFAKDVVKTYWLPATLSCGAVVLIWRGRTKLRRELMTMIAQYTLAVENYRKLYNRIKEKYGEEEAQELAYGVRMADAVDAETGEVSKVPIVDPNGNTSMYAFMFSQGEFDHESGEWVWLNRNWSDRKVNDYLLVKNAEAEAERQLIGRGYYFLGELKEYLGVAPGSHDWTVGWWYQKNRENRVDLGVFDDRTQLPFNIGFADTGNPQKECLINPNVDGPIGFIFDDIERYDFRFGKRARKKKRMPSNEEMFGEDFARKLK